MKENENKRILPVRGWLFRNRSVFWEYIVLYVLLMTITGFLLMLILGRGYLQTLNHHQLLSMQEKADHAVATLDAQVNSMFEQSLKLSTQPVFWSSNHEKAYRKIMIAESLSNYQSYSTLASSFALLYQIDADDVTVFQSNGTTADLKIFLSHCGVTDEQAAEDFLLGSAERGRSMRTDSGVLIAYPVSSDVGAQDATLCFYVSTSDIERRVLQTSDIAPGTYCLSFHHDILIENPMAKHTISAGDTTGWQISANVPSVSMYSILDNGLDLLLFFGVLLLLAAAVFVLAWYCYKPILHLTRQFAAGDAEVESKNEFARLSEAMLQMQQHSRALTQETSAQAALLREYALLMFLNNSNSPYARTELKNVGVEFPLRYFFVLTLIPCSGQAITQENIKVLTQSLPDIAEDGELLYAVECNPTTHQIAVICNTEEETSQPQITERLHTYLNQIPRRFLVSEGPVTDFLGVSASYLTAQSSLRVIASAQTDGGIKTERNDEDISQLVSRLVFQIECSDCQSALATLERCMEVMQRNPSELIRRYHVMNLTCAVQRLCEQTDYPLTDAQLSMMLPSNHLQSLHYAMLQLIPQLCAHIGQENEQAIQPTSQLVMDYLNRHFSDYDISAQSVAEALGIGINRTYAIIREQTGHSYKTILTQLRIQHAKTLLENDALPISEIGKKVGYGSASYFIKVFKSSVGMPPDAYRKRFLSGAENHPEKENPSDNEETIIDE